MARFKVVEKDNHLAVHCVTWSRERGELWIRNIKDNWNPRLFTDSSLTPDSFEVIEDANND